MPCRIINISKSNELVLGFLFPTYSLVKSVDHCIFREDIKTAARKNEVFGMYSDSFVISTVLYDELWDTQKIAEETLKFMHDTFGCRKKKLELREDHIVEDVVHFITYQTLDDLEETPDLFELYDLFGSNAFYTRFAQLCGVVPVSKLIFKMNLFFTRILSDSPITKKYSRLKPKLIKNMPDALDKFIYREHVRHDTSGMSYLYFCKQLVK